MARRKTIRERRRIFVLEAKVTEAITNGSERWDLITGDGVYSGGYDGWIQPWLTVRCTQGAAMRLRPRLVRLGASEITVTAHMEELRHLLRRSS